MRTHVLAAALVLGAGGCSQEIVIGVLDGATTGTGIEASSGSAGSLDGATVDDTATTSASTTGDGPPEDCGAPTGHTVCDFDGDPFHAIGLGCPGGEFETQPIEAAVLSSPDPDAWRVIREYGNPSWVASEGSNLLALTSGVFPAADDSGRVEIPLGWVDATDGGNGNPDGVPLPAPIVPEPGCDGFADCSGTLEEPWQAAGPASDLLSVSFEIDVPPGTHGYRVDLAWFSAELPARHQEPGTDVVVWWQSSEAFTGNVATLQGEPLTAGGVAGFAVAQGLLGNDPPLFGTGFDGTTGLPCDLPGQSYVDCPRSGGTGWLTLDAPAVPGERMRIAVAVLDLLDDDRDTTILLDDWRWHCEGCEPGVDCGLSASARAPGSERSSERGIRHPRPQ